MTTKDARSWFSAKALKDGEAEIAIYDSIGAFGISAGDFRDELLALGDVKKITVRINCDGGNAFDSISIHNLLARHKARINVSIDGMAASGASLIAMAGDEVVMPENAMMMIHNPAGMVLGESKDMRALASALDKIKLAMISTYAAKSGLEREEIAQIMDDETWFTAAEALEAGLADKVVEPAKISVRFDLSHFKNAPAAAGRKPRGAAAPTMESDMTDAEKAAEAAAKVAEATKKAAADAAADTSKQAADAAADTAKKAADAARASGAETQEQMQARITAEVKERTTQIMAACSLAGASNEKAVEFIASGKTLGAILAELQTLRAEGKLKGDGKKADEVSSRHKPEVDAAVTAGWDKIISTHNAKLPNGRAA